MKNTIFTLVFSLFCLYLNAQRTPQYTAKFYFEDAVGNKDTVIVGYDDDALVDTDFDLIDEDFAEQVDNSPFKEGLDVRLREYFSPHPYEDERYRLFKNLIEKSTYGNNCLKPLGTYFYVHTNHFPITVKWDLNFLSSCTKGTMFTPDDWYGLIKEQLWLEYDYIRYCCLDKKTEWVIDIPQKPINNPLTEPEENTIFIEWPVEGSTQVKHTIWGFKIVYIHEFGETPCNLVHTEDWDIHRQIRAISYPNPTTDLMQLLVESLDGEARLQVYDAMGTLVFQKEDIRSGIHEIPMHNLCSGVYYYKLHQNINILISGKWIKI